MESWYETRCLHGTWKIKDELNIHLQIPTFRRLFFIFKFKGNKLVLLPKYSSEASLLIHQLKNNIFDILYSQLGSNLHSVLWPNSWSWYTWNKKKITCPWRPIRKEVLFRPQTASVKLTKSSIIVESLMNSFAVILSRAWSRDLLEMITLKNTTSKSKKLKIKYYCCIEILEKIVLRNNIL